jgi:alpha,alpha-trehalase
LTFAFGLAYAEVVMLKILPGLKKELDFRDVAHAIKYIADYWPKLARFNPEDKDDLIGLPKPYLVPSQGTGGEFNFEELYYWDSYFMIQGLLDEQHKEFVLGILEDLVSLFDRFKIIPNASRNYLTGRSQPPLLTSFILDVYNAYHLDKQWLDDIMQVAKDEYKTVWLGAEKPNARRVYKGLSRYYDVNYLDELAEAESGWDATPRFNRHCLSYLPVDLNCLLYKYETDFAYTARLLGDEIEALAWQRAAAHRQATINKLMWSDLHSFYYDYNYEREHHGRVSSLAAYYSMWAGLVDRARAEKLVKALKHFEHKGGLATTESMALAHHNSGTPHMQWAYPNGWAPLHFMVVKGLQRYGYHQDAKRIATKWLKTNLDWFNVHGEFLEKYDVVQPGKPATQGLYPPQVGFGWTNAIFERFCQEFIDK